MDILAQRTIEFLTENEYTDKSIQKGFIEKISGCVEHTEAVTDMLQDAKKNGKPIVTTWLDLQNAYGTIPCAQSYIVRLGMVPCPRTHQEDHYYDELFIRVKTEEWTTDWI